MNMTGKFITFEGCDGCGKTTIAQKLYEQLTSEGYEVLLTREPGGIRIAEEIRKIILNPEYSEMDDRCEALLYAAARRQHLTQKVLPALERGAIVLCDRFIDSSLAYQGHARKIGVQEVFELNKFAIDHHMPDATLYLDVDLEVGLQRVKGRGAMDRLDAQGASFHAAVREGYAIVNKMYKHRIHIVDANLEIDAVFAQAYAIIKEVIV